MAFPQRAPCAATFAVRRALFLGLVLGVAACSDRRRSTDVSADALHLLTVRHGRLADVYAIQETAHGTGVQLVERDVLIGYQLPEGCEHFGVDPDSLNPRVRIAVSMQDAAFPVILDALRRGPMDLVATDSGEPDAVPRDAALALVFDRELPVGQEFFADVDEQGRVRGGKNLTAVRLVRRDGARGKEPSPIASRLLPRGNSLVVDPVLSETEAAAWQLPQSGTGLPPSELGGGANVELRLTVEQQDSLPGLRSGALRLEGSDIVVAFRAGNDSDRSGHLAGGFAAGRTPPRLLGQITTYLEQVVDHDAATQEVTLFKNGAVHDIDDGDVIRLFIDNSGIPVVVTDVIADPVDDRGAPAVAHVRVLVPRTVGLRENDPRRLPNYPSNPRSPEGERWLVANAPRAVLVVEFTGERRAPNGQIYGDDPRWFVQWSPAPLVGALRSEPCDNVSPFAGAVVRFSQPVNSETVRPADTLFFATRDVLDPAGMLDFVRQRNIDPDLFDQNKYRTPHLVAASAVPVDGAHTTFRLQTPLGFYLDGAMRQSDESLAFADKRYKYHLHVVGGPSGIRDLSGQELDLRWLTPRLHVGIPFALDMRRANGGQPLFADNFVASVTRRFESQDEDEQPSYYIADEVQARNAPPNANAFPLPDLSGAVVLVGGGLQGRPTSRARVIADDLNQPPPPPQTSPLRWCPQAVAGEPQIATPSAAVAFGSPIQNPTNPFGCRLQTTWREIDLGLSRLDPFDFNLDVEAMYWGVHRTITFVNDEFARTSLYLGHGERRPEPCIGGFSSLPTLAASGLEPPFADNYVHNLDRSGAKEDAPAPHAAYVDQPWKLDPTQLVREPNGVNRYAPAPAFTEPAFVWRDERVVAQGGNSDLGSDVAGSLRLFEPYIISPWLQGRGRAVTVQNGQFQFANGFWSNAQNMLLGGGLPRLDNLTGGSVGAVALPLLADVWVDPHDPADRSFSTIGANGWQIALTVQSSALPGFRAFSGGGVVGGVTHFVSRTSPDWQRAMGGFHPITGARTLPVDNSLYWSMFDLAKTRSVATFGFVEILDPHRMPATSVDPRLGPFFNRAFPGGHAVVYAPAFDPPLERLPPGTSVTVEYRGAGAVDPQPWRAVEDRYATVPDAKNFPLDPLKAGDAHIRKNDTRLVGGTPRDWWTHLYNKNLTTYTADPRQLSDPAFVTRFAGPHETFTPDDVRYVNWRFVLQNSAGAVPRAPRLDTFMLSYRFEQR